MGMLVVVCARQTYVVVANIIVPMAVKCVKCAICLA